MELTGIIIGISILAILVIVAIIILTLRDRHSPPTQGSNDPTPQQRSATQVRQRSPLTHEALRQRNRNAFRRAERPRRHTNRQHVFQKIEGFGVYKFEFENNGSTWRVFIDRFPFQTESPNLKKCGIIQHKSIGRLLPAVLDSREDALDAARCWAQSHAHFMTSGEWVYTAPQDRKLQTDPFYSRAEGFEQQFVILIERHGSDGFRVYIEQMPEFQQPITDCESTGRGFDGNRYFVASAGPIRTKHKAKRLAAAWCKRMLAMQARTSRAGTHSAGQNQSHQHGYRRQHAPRHSSGHPRAHTAQANNWVHAHAN